MNDDNNTASKLMNDEIKEIDITKDLYLCSPLLNKKCPKTSCYINNGSCCHTVNKEYSQEHLLDYITNLQQENTLLKHNCKQAQNSCRQHRLASKSHIRRLQRREKQIEDYKSRCEKAIEYIMSELVDEWSIKNDGHVHGSDLPVDAITPILDILNGKE